uniref:Oligosaccharyltransferase complex subunit n=1 Tax=Callithrix jacchus TaxID=9483 RepID=A0A8I3X4B8_CALJA
METLYRVPFLVLECPNLKLKKPPWLHMPSAMTVYALVVVSYFLITGDRKLQRGVALCTGELAVRLQSFQSHYPFRPQFQDLLRAVLLYF